MGLSEPVQKPEEAEHIDLRTFGRPPIDQVPTEKHTPQIPPSPKALPLDNTLPTPGKVREKNAGRDGCPEGRPRRPPPSPGLEKRVTGEHRAKEAGVDRRQI